MAVARGIVRQLDLPSGGGLHTTEWRYEDGTYSHQTWTKSRMVFPLVHIGDTVLKRAYVAVDAVGYAIRDNVKVGDSVALYYFQHLLRKQVMIGFRSETSGQTFSMSDKGVFAALLWYGVFSAMGTGVLGAVVGFVLGMVLSPIAGLVFLLGILGGIGVSWYTYYRFLLAHREMRAAGVQAGAGVQA